MNKKYVKACLFTSGVFAGAGIACFIAKLIELTMRTAHAWAQTCLILGFVFLGVALLILCGMVIVDTLLSKKNENKASVSEEDLLEKYKSKKIKK